jgi:hypothetical protein
MSPDVPDMSPQGTFKGHAVFRPKKPPVAARPGPAQARETAEKGRDQGNSRHIPDISQTVYPSQVQCLEICLVFNKLRTFALLVGVYAEDETRRREGREGEIGHRWVRMNTDEFISFFGSELSHFIRPLLGAEHASKPRSEATKCE